MVNNFYQDIKVHGTLDADNISQALRNNILLNLYPVGAIYMSAVNTSPAQLFGGTWEQLDTVDNIYAWKRLS